MEPESSFPTSQVPSNCPILSHIDPVHIQTTHLRKIHLNIILHIYAWVYQVVSLHQISLPKLCSYNVTS